MSSIQLGEDEITHLRSQNDQLWKIIEKQRVMIQTLQKENARLSADRDGLTDKLESLERENGCKQRVTSLLISPQTLEEMAETQELTPNETPTSPMPPPRSPYRPLKPENDLDSPILTPSKSSSSSVDKRQSSTVRGRSKRESAIYSRSLSQHSTKNKNASSPNLTYHEKSQDRLNMTNIQLKLVGSTIKSNDKGKEVIAFIISIGSPHQDEFEEKWRVEKLYSDFLTLDSKLKTQLTNRSLNAKMGKLPDKALFSNNAPNKVDQRKIALEQYLQHIISLPLEDASDLCEFLSTDIVEAVNYKSFGQKEGYLTKRGKNFGGWKTRYFVMNDNVLEYYESKEGTQLGSIRLTNAQIGRQISSSTPTTEEYNNIYRHAFLIVEQRKASSSNYARHILCANSDDDRDEWVQALLENIQKTTNDSKKKSSVETSRKLSKEGKNEKPLDSRRPPTPLSSESSESLLMDARMSLDQATPKKRPPLTRRSSMCALDRPKQYEPKDELQRAASPNIMMGRQEDVNAAAEQEKKTRNKANRMTFWGKKMFSGNNEQPKPLTTGEQQDSKTNPSGFRGFLTRSSNEQTTKVENKPAKQVFGVSLEEAVLISRINEGYELPAIVYRCIEFLDAMNAVQEEGLYRLSGSNATMKALRERFDQEGDVDLLASRDEYDVHVVAGLLKLWLRELPTSVLTRDLRVDFLHVIGN
ncbi:hypothetical protein CU098_000659 [Rhizopus stolonifer]|uniref:Uncharacterized protein n=1 Tax=Rhizopus stolonifer TaxID=4846 RepID=A0A367J108_RHIST|nr:hypothetical protein CU098_000659 [Rhizopus stolonifer]